MVRKAGEWILALAIPGWLGFMGIASIHDVGESSFTLPLGISVGVFLLAAMVGLVGYGIRYRLNRLGKDLLLIVSGFPFLFLMTTTISLFDRTDGIWLSLLFFLPVYVAHFLVVYSSENEWPTKQEAVILCALVGLALVALPLLFSATRGAEEVRAASFFPPHRPFMAMKPIEDSVYFRAAGVFLVTGTMVVIPILYRHNIWAGPKEPAPHANETDDLP